MIWDEALTKRIINGDKLAFELCYRQLSPAVFTAIYRICKDNDLSKDILQDTFLTTYQKVEQLKSDTNMLAWLKRVAFNKTINAIKRLNKFGDDDVELKVDPVHSIAQSIEDERLFLLILSNVTLVERLVLWLYFVEQYKHHEIAELTGKSLSYSKIIVSRAIAKIKQLPVINEVSNG